MGKSAVSGPFYGAKANLWTFGPYTQTGSSGASTALATANASIVVPNYEDWFVTEVGITCSTNSSVAAAHGVTIKVEGGSTTGVPPRSQIGQGSTNAATIATLTNPAGSTTWSTWATATATAGEYEGTWCPAGSSIRILTSGVSLLGLLQVNLRGFTRYVDSTRPV